jgi:hypothetical protein
MAKILNPLQFSTAYKIKPEAMARLGVLDPTLNVDTKLFVDPMLLASSSHAEIKRSRVTYEDHFSKVIDFLDASRMRGDVAWRSAKRLLTFPEVAWTCLGYGAATVRGSGFGVALCEDLIATAKEIVDLGVKNPDLFVAMALFEQDIGPDRISDLTTRVILSDLFAFNRRILGELKVPTRTYEWNNVTVELAANPKLQNEPVILLPLDILRHLPLALDWEDVIDAARHNRALRDRVNADLGNIWSAKTRKDKAEIRDAAMQSKRSFETLLDIVNAPPKVPYNANRDPEGELFWRRLLATIAVQEPLTLDLKGRPDKKKAIAVVDKIIEQYRHLIEDRRYSKELYRDNGSPRPERATQRFFFAVADCYCKANNLDVTPEADTGAGSVDFKFSASYSCRIVVEIKLSTNPKLIDGLIKQITAYSTAEDAIASYYVVVDVGRLGRKDQSLVQIRDGWKNTDKLRPELKFIDGKVRASASKR